MTALRSDSATCNACDKMVFDRAFACGVYEGAISTSVLALKKTTGDRSAPQRRDPRRTCSESLRESRLHSSRSAFKKAYV